MMKTLAGILLLSSMALGALDNRRFTCSECVEEMRNLGRLIRDGGPMIHDYLVANYCPTLDEDEVDMCVEDLSRWYIGMLHAIVENFFEDNAVHICQTAGLCEAWHRRYTCEECIEGLEWVEAYMEDPIMVAEYTIYLEQNYCLDEWTGCKELVFKHFAAMHLMAMEKFMIPVEICNTEPVCGASLPPTGGPPTRPPTLYLTYPAICF